MLWFSVALLALFASVQGRAVNISNTWVLPEEGFPVFYRYFRDRISWYEADAVCQFHHANLVTVDTTAQYDAVRAYLKELDISSAVWVGLIRSNPDGDFTWTDYRGLSSEGYWSSAPDARSAPLCAAADPAADYRWEARACGGPTVASFICELPVPQWALGNEGCMVRALPALTVLYLPESAAVQLTADCGLAGVKRVQCTGNVKREDLLRELSCSEEEEITTLGTVSTGSASSITTEAVFTDQDTTTESTTEENGTTEHEDDINQSSTFVPPSTLHSINFVKEYKKPTKPINVIKLNQINSILDKKIDLTLAHNNNLQSNYIPKIATGDNYLSNEQLDKIEDEKHMQHKMLHEEIARLGNLENIFTQPTDHFVPPLVMAKAKISDDMTVLSLQEKHAQQMAEEHLSRLHSQYNQNDHVYNNNLSKTTTEQSKAETSSKVVVTETTKLKDSNKKDKIKTSMPKKYFEKSFDPKSSKVQKVAEIKPTPVAEKVSDTTATQTESTTKHAYTTSLPLVGRLDEDDDSALDLTVLLKDTPDIQDEKIFYNYSGDISRLEIVKNNTQNNDTEIKFYDVEATEEAKAIFNKDEISQNKPLNHEIINITIISEEHPTTTRPISLEVTTKQHIIVENTSVNPTTTLVTKHTTENSPITTTGLEDIKPNSFIPVLNISVSAVSDTVENKTTIVESLTTKTISLTTSTEPSTTIVNKSMYNDITVKDTTTITSTHVTHEESIVDDSEEAQKEFDEHSNSTDTLDDFNSPLLSGANEPVRRPSRSRRPQQPPNRNKFNPFRILG